jgi:hypothetical protein
MTPNRLESVAALREASGARIEIMTAENLPIVPEFPLHPAFPYLCASHKGDYIRTYLMHVHGGAYADVKRTTRSWATAFADMRDDDAWVNGYTEIEKDGVAYKPVAHMWKKLVGNCAFICRPRTILTHEWFTDMNRLLDEKLEELKAHPAASPFDRKEWGPYPLEWNEVGGRIFQKIIPRYLPHVRHSVPTPVFTNYR